MSTSLNTTAVDLHVDEHDVRSQQASQGLNPHDAPGGPITGNQVVPCSWQAAVGKGGWPRVGHCPGRERDHRDSAVMVCPCHLQLGACVVDFSSCTWWPFGDGVWSPSVVPQQ